MMSNVIIERETDEEGDVIVYQLLIRRVGDGSPEQRGLPAIHNCSRSRDHLVKESGQWRIKERRLQVEY